MNQSEERTPVPDGDYKCTANGCYIKPAIGYPYIELEHTVITGEYGGKKIWQKIYVTENSLRYSYPHFQALGLLSLEAIQDAKIDDWVCDITVKTEKNRSGKTRHVVTELVVVERGAGSEQTAQ